MQVSFSAGITVIESERELIETLRDHDLDNWIDYKALDNALYFQLGKFFMHEVRFKAKYYGKTHAFIQVETGFCPAGWFSVQRVKRELQ